MAAKPRWLPGFGIVLVTSVSSADAEAEVTSRDADEQACEPNDRCVLLRVFFDLSGELRHFSGKRLGSESRERRMR